MIKALTALGYFGVALLIAWLQMEYLRARDERRALAAANIDALNTGLIYLPVALLVVFNNWWIVLADVAANWVASYLGVRKLTND